MKFFKNSNNAAQARITFYDGVDRTESGKKLSSEAIKKSAKQTVNLCKRERKGMSFATFCLVLAIILIVLAVVEFFAAYRPYKQMEAKQKELAEKQAQLNSLNGAMTDREAVQNEYRQYNYEKFPFDLVDNQDVLNLVKEKVFPYGKIQKVLFAGNILTLIINDLAQEQIDALVKGLDADGADSIVKHVAWSRNSGENNSEARVISMTITFKDAVQGGN